MKIEIIPDAKDLVNELFQEYNDPVLLIFAEVLNACVTPDLSKWELQLLESDLIDGLENIEKHEENKLPCKVYVEKLDPSRFPETLHIGAKKFDAGIGLEQVFP